MTSLNRWDCSRLNKKGLLFPWGEILKKMKVIPPEDATMVCFQQDGGCCNSKDGLGSKIPIGVEDLVLGLKEYRNSHTLTTTTTGSKNSQKEVYNQTDNQNSVLCPQRLPLYWFLVLFEVKCKTHTQQQDQLITII